MAPLSRFLSGVFLKHETYGTHLDRSGKTIDIDLEIRNFFAIMGVVSEIWSEKFIDKCPVHCIPVDIGCKFTPDEPDPIWVANHVIQGRYMKQIVKCHISTCSHCAFSSNLFHGHIVQKYIDQISTPENKKCSPGKVFGIKPPSNP